MQIEAGLELFLGQLSADGRARHTTDQIARHVRLFEVWLREVGHSGEVEKIDHVLVARFIGSERVRLTADGRPRKPGSANAVRSSVKSFCGYLNAIGATPRNAGALVRRARCGAPLPRALAEVDASRLRSALALASKPTDLRDAALIGLMLDAGLRVGSATQQLVEDLDLERGEARVVRAKGNREQQAVLPPPLVDLLRRYVGSRREGWLFPAPSGGPITTRQAARRLALWSERAGLGRRAHPHSLRHRYAVSLYERCEDVNLVRVALGHASVASTTVYAQLSGSRLRQVVCA